jgi:hypothetical protein
LPIRVHDLRATFITINLANGKTETWIADRTGHRSSDEINGYRRQARTAAELGLGELAPLDVAIPELNAPPPGTSGDSSPGGAAAPPESSPAGSEASPTVANGSQAPTLDSEKPGDRSGMAPLQTGEASPG